MAQYHYTPVPGGPIEEAKKAGVPVGIAPISQAEVRERIRAKPSLLRVWAVLNGGIPERWERWLE